MTAQGGLFDDVDPPVAPRPVRSRANDDRDVQPAATPNGLAPHLDRWPDGLHVGTSSWSYPGWAGIVYAREHDATTLARHGLAAYGAHRWLRTVSIDRTYYGALSADELAGYAAVVPAYFRFMVKAPAELTTPTLRDAEGLPRDNPHWLDPEAARRLFVEPATTGLGAYCGPLVFQCPPQGLRVVRQPRQFAQRVDALLAGLPRGPLYAFELRDPALWTEAFGEVLAAHGAVWCASVHPGAAPLSRQTELLARMPAGPLVVRWNLAPKYRYAEAKARYAPFDRLVEEDPEARGVLADWIGDALDGGRRVWVIANNKAEGSAPLTLLKLLEVVLARV
jgi:uncharacterized protein YecE (DUF72 family)